MSRDNRIEEFIQKSLDAGIPVPSFVGLLTARGWTEKQAYSALADHYQSQTGIEVPPRPSSGASARDAFFYLLIFSTLCVAIDYSSRDAITRAASIVASQLKPADPRSPESFAEHLTQSLTAHNAEVDLLIRTGGEKRLSDFLLWECAYAELFFTDCMWPDFTEADLDAALADFHRRHRRFGALPSVPPVQSSEQATSNIPRDPRPGYYGTL